MREVDEHGNELGDCWQVFRAFEQKMSKSRSLQRVARSLEDAHISRSPLLNERCDESGRQTAYEAYEPENIHSAVRCRRMKGRVRQLRQWGNGIGRDLVARRGELLRYSTKHELFGSDKKLTGLRGSLSNPGSSARRTQ